MTIHNRQEIVFIQDRFRSSSQNTILLDSDTALTLRVEIALWHAHVEVNKRFRSALEKVNKIPEGASSKPTDHWISDQG